MNKTKIPKLVYNAMFKAVFSNNKKVFNKMIQAILEYCKIDLDIKDKELIIKNNELPLDKYSSKQLICDYIIKIDKHIDLNIEINKSFYPGLTERNMIYSFKISYEHFKAGDKYKEFNKYKLLQVNFNNFKNEDNEPINTYLMVNTKDVNNVLSNNLCIINIDIESCFNLVYNNTKLDEISYLERFAGILYCEYLEDISNILGGDMLTMEEKCEFLNDIKEKASDKDIKEALKFEDNIEYRFDLVREDALEKGISQGITQGFTQGISEGIEQNTIKTIKEMVKNNIDIDTISKVTDKSIDEIEKIIK